MPQLALLQGMVSGTVLITGAVGEGTIRSSKLFVGDLEDEADTMDDSMSATGIRAGTRSSKVVNCKICLLWRGVLWCVAFVALALSPSISRYRLDSEQATTCTTPCCQTDRTSRDTPQDLKDNRHPQRLYNEEGRPIQTPINQLSLTLSWL
jgi:hypothetical protein